MKKIYLFCLPCSWGPDVIGYAVTQDGRGLANHLCSSVDWAKHDMGLTSGWKHDLYAAAVPEGFRLEWVDDVDRHPGLQEALRLNRELLEGEIR